MKIFLWLLLLLSSCAHIPSERPKNTDETIKNAQTLYDLGEIEASISHLRLLLDKPYEPAHDQAYELIIEWLLQIHRDKEAKLLASHFLADHQNSPSAEKIIKLFDQKDHEEKIDEPKEETNELNLEERKLDDEDLLESKLKTDDKPVIGVLLPLSGSFASFGKSTLAAMAMAWQKPLEQKEQELLLPNMKVVIRDSKSDAKTAEIMTKSLIKDHHASVVLGEITPEASLLMAKVCEDFSTPMVSLSRHPSLLGLKNIFIFNSSQNQTVAHLVDHAMKSGHKKFGILFPKHNYGMTMSSLFFDEVIKKGGQVTALENYDTDILSSVKKLVGTFYGSLAHVDFDVLFIPEFQKLSLVIPTLMQQDILVSNDPDHMKSYALATKTNGKYVQLMGPESWNDQNTLKKISSHIDGAYFVDSMSFEHNEDLKNFAKDFQSKSGYPLTTLEVYAHDAASLLQNLAKSGVKNGSFAHEIANFNKKAGLLNVSFLANGELDAPKVGFKISNKSVALANDSL